MAFKKTWKVDGLMKWEKWVIPHFYKKKPSNWIEGMSMELKDKKRDTILRVFVYLIFIPGMCVLSWYGVYKLMCWLWCCHG